MPYTDAEIADAFAKEIERKIGMIYRQPRAVAFDLYFRELDGRGEVRSWDSDIGRDVVVAQRRAAGEI